MMIAREELKGQFPRSPAISGVYNRDFGHDVI